MSLNWRDWTVPRHSLAEIVEEVAEKFVFFDDDILVSTYHKSGTTLTQQMVSCLLHGPQVAESRLLGLRSPFIDFRNPVVKGEALPSPMQVAAELQRPRVLKTHLPPAFHQRHLRLQSPAPKNIVVMRNPKDMLVSAFHHFSNLTTISDSQKSSFAEFWRNHMLRPAEVGMHDFFDFNLSWWALRQHPRVLILFYEDIVRNKEAQFRRIADFIGVELSDELLQSSMHVSSFSSMQQNANVNISLMEKGNAFNPGFSFIRKGEIGDWKNHFTVADSEMIDSVIRDRLQGSDLQFVFE